MGDIEGTLDGDETILWQGKIRRCLLRQRHFEFPLRYGLFAIAAHFVVGTTGSKRPIPSPHSSFFRPFSGRLSAGRGVSVWRLLAYLRFSYAITSQRVVSQYGVIEHDVTMVDFDQIVDASVEINLTDIFLGFGRTGSVSLVNSPPDDEDNADPTADCSFAHLPSLRRASIVPPCRIRRENRHPVSKPPTARHKSRILDNLYSAHSAMTPRSSSLSAGPIPPVQPWPNRGGVQRSGESLATLLYSPPYAAGKSPDGPPVQQLAAISAAAKLDATGTRGPRGREPSNDREHRRESFTAIDSACLSPRPGAHGTGDRPFPPLNNVPQPA